MGENPVVMYTHGPTVDVNRPDGGLPPAMGTHNIQVLRANRSNGRSADGFGWTYNHQPMLTHWKGRFLLQYLSGPVGEHLPPGHTLLTVSEDGGSWTKPRVLFPVYTLPDGTHAVMHQRMGFHASESGRLLALGFYGICPNCHRGPNNGDGVGRVVREVREDLSLGPIHFLRLNRHAGWHEGNVAYPMYTESDDKGFVDACGELLANPLACLGMWEEDRSRDGFYAIEDDSLKAFCWYRRADGKVVGLWKGRKAAVSADGGRTWSGIGDTGGIVYGGAKIWGQRTPDGGYALVYNPDTDRRWPLAVATGSDGVEYGGLLCVHGEIPPTRFPGQYKDPGPQYVRGVPEDGDRPGDGAMWLTYSVNKEDIWVARVPVPIRHGATEPVDDDFTTRQPGWLVEDWNTYSPKWAPVGIALSEQSGLACLELRNAEPYDYSRADRLFPESARVRIRLEAFLSRTRPGGVVALEIGDVSGRRPVRLWIDDAGILWAMNGGSPRMVRRWPPDGFMVVLIDADTETGVFSVGSEDGNRATDLGFAEDSGDMHRFTIRTGIHRNGVPTGGLHDYHGACLPESDTPAPELRFGVYRITIDGTDR